MNIFPLVKVGGVKGYHEAKLIINTKIGLQREILMGSRNIRIRSVSQYLQGATEYFGLILETMFHHGEPQTPVVSKNQTSLSS